MKIVSYNDYLKNHLNKHPKNMVFFNPDNTATLFEANDGELRDWVYKNGAKLKEGRIKIDEENAKKILVTITQEKADSETAKSDEQEKKLESLPIDKIVEQVSQKLEDSSKAPSLSEEERKSLIKEITEAEKVTIKVLAAALVRFITLVR